jgi:hypothetical protein
VLHADLGPIPPAAVTDPAQLPIYDISARNEVSNLQIVRRVLAALDLDPDEWTEHIPDRPNHDRRYVITPKKLETQLGWQPTSNSNPASPGQSPGMSTTAHGGRRSSRKKATSSSTGANHSPFQRPTNLKVAGRTNQPAASTRRA